VGRLVAEAEPVIEDGWRQQVVDVDGKLESRRLLPAGQQGSG